MNISTADRSISAFAVFKTPAFSLIWIGKFISTVGSSLSWLVASLLVFRLTGLALSVGLLYIMQALPSLFIGLIAGVIVDRYNRKSLMIISDVVRAITAGLIPILVLDQFALYIPGGVIWLYILVILSNMATQFFDPAFSSILPDIASPEDLAAANALMQISSFGSTAIGFAAAGLIVVSLPFQWAFYLDAFTFLFSAGCILFAKISTPRAEGQTSVSVVVHNLREGMGYLFQTPAIRSLYLVNLPGLLSVGLWNSLLLPFALIALHATPFQFGLQEGLTSIGFVLCSLLLARIADRFREAQLVIISLLGMGLLTLYYSQVSLVFIAIIVVTLHGFVNAPRYIAQSLLIQRQTPREKLGRVFSVFFVSRDIFFLIGMGAVGLADLFGVRIVCIICGLLWLGSGVLAFFLPGLRYKPAVWVETFRSLGRKHSGTVSRQDAISLPQVPADPVSETL